MNLVSTAMLIPSTYKSLGIHEHVFTTKEGVLVRATFEIREVNGRVRGRVLKVEPIIGIDGDCSQSRCSMLSGSTSSCPISTQLFSDGDIISPYSNFDFLVSQMTRAPAAK